METKQQKKVGVIGAGAWGTALAHALARENNDVEMLDFEPDASATITPVSERTPHK